MNALERHPAPWRFDGHGINDKEGNRICKVQSCNPYETEAGRLVRNRTFDNISNMIKAAPDMFAALKMALRHIDKDALEYSEGDHGSRVYVADEIRRIIQRAYLDD